MPPSEELWSAALARAQWQRRDDVYFQAVRDRQALQEKLRNEAVEAEKKDEALNRATRDLELMRGVVHSLQTKQQQVKIGEEERYRMAQLQEQEREIEIEEEALRTQQSHYRSSPPPSAQQTQPTQRLTRPTGGRRMTIAEERRSLRAAKNLRDKIEQHASLAETKSEALTMSWQPRRRPPTASPSYLGDTPHAEQGEDDEDEQQQQQLRVEEKEGSQEEEDKENDEEVSTRATVRHAGSSSSGGSNDSSGSGRGDHPDDSSDELKTFAANVGLAPVGGLTPHTAGVSRVAGAGGGGGGGGGIALQGANATVTVDAARLLKECARSAENAKAALLRSHAAEAEARHLRACLDERGAETMAMTTMLSTALAAAEEHAACLGEQVVAMRGKGHAAAFANLAAEARRKRERRLSDGEHSVLSAQRDAAQAEEAARRSAAQAELAAFARALEEAEAQTAAQARRVKAADAATAEAAARAAEAAEAAKRSELDRERAIAALQHDQAAAAAAGERQQAERQQEEQAARTSAELAHAALQNENDGLRADLARSRDEHASELEWTREEHALQLRRVEEERTAHVARLDLAARRSETRMLAAEARAAIAEATLGAELRASEAEANDFALALTAEQHAMATMHASFTAIVRDDEAEAEVLGDALAVARAQRQAAAFEGLGREARRKLGVRAAESESAALLERAQSAERLYLNTKRELRTMRYCLSAELREEEAMRQEASETAHSKAQLAEATRSAAASRAEANEARWAQERAALMQEHMQAMAESQEIAREALDQSKSDAKEAVAAIADAAEEAAARHASHAADALKSERAKNAESLAMLQARFERAASEALATHATLVGAVAVAEAEATDVGMAAEAMFRQSAFAQREHEQAMADEELARGLVHVTLATELGETESALNVAMGRLSGAEQATQRAFDAVKAADTSAADAEDAAKVLYYHAPDSSLSPLLSAHSSSSSSPPSPPPAPPPRLW